MNMCKYMSKIGISLSLNFYLSLIEPQLILCTYMGEVYHCKNKHLLRLKSEQTITFRIIYIQSDQQQQFYEFSLSLVQYY